MRQVTPRVRDTVMSAYNPLQDDNKSANPQYNTMEVVDNTESKRKEKKIYTFTQLISIITIIAIVFFVICLLVVFLIPRYECVSPTQGPSTEPQFPWKEQLLPNFTYPLHYSIYFDPDLTNFKLNGEVNLTFRVWYYTEFIVLNIKELELVKIELLNKSPKLNFYIVDKMKEQLYVSFGCELIPDTNYTISLKYESKLENNMEGIYLTSYIHPQGMKRYLVATFLKDKNARKVFPCFDEPGFKSTYQLNVLRTYDYDVISNTEVKETDVMTTRFEVTAPMSTSSLAFLVSDFKSQKRDYAGISIHIFTSSQYYGQIRFASQVSIEILEYYIKKLNFSYTLPKLDIVSVPESGYSGSSALGLIFMKPTNIIQNSDESVESKEIIISSLAHEIAHQFFGNQVTMKFWENMWLMEGFATYLELLAIREVLKTNQEAIEFLQSTLNLGRFPNSQPLHTDIRKESEITNIYDELAYHKGAALLWMLDSFLGREKFLNCLSDFLISYRFKNASFDDIWNIMDKNNASQAVSVLLLMENWTKENGYPLLTIIRHQGYFVVKQKPFVLSDQRDAGGDVLWKIPFSFFTDKNLVEWKILEEQEHTFNITLDTMWIKANANQTGFYRVNYDEPSWKVLAGVLNNNNQALNSIDRSNLIDDALGLARIGELQINLAFEIISYVKNEQDYAPWKTILNHFHDLFMLLKDDSNLPLFQRYYSSILDPILNKVGSNDGGSSQTIKLRSSVLFGALETENSKIINEAIDLFKRWMENNELETALPGTIFPLRSKYDHIIVTNEDYPRFCNNYSISIPPNLQQIVYLAGIKYGSRMEWEFGWKIYKVTEDPRKKILLLNALGNSRDIWQLKQYLELCLNQSEIALQDVPLVIATVASNPFGQLLAWEFVQEHWNYISKIFGRNSIFLNVILTKVTAYFSTEYKYNQVKAFFENVELDTGITKQCLEKIDSNIFWHRKVKEQFVNWLLQN